MKELSMVKALYTLLALSLTSPAFSQAPGPQVQVELKIIEINKKDYDEPMAELKAAKGAPASATDEKDVTWDTSFAVYGKVYKAYLEDFASMNDDL